MRVLKVTLAVIAAGVLSGCCSVANVPSCSRPCKIYDWSPTRVHGNCRAMPDRSWSCADSYNGVDSTTTRVYF